MSHFWKQCALALLCAPMVLAHAGEAHSDKEKQADIERHRAMAAAHTAVAECMASGKDTELCLKELQAACKGLAIGKYCGMKHAH